MALIRVIILGIFAVLASSAYADWTYDMAPNDSVNNFLTVHGAVSQDTSTYHSAPGAAYWAGNDVADYFTSPDQSELEPTEMLACAWVRSVDDGNIHAFIGKGTQYTSYIQWTSSGRLSTYVYTTGSAPGWHYSSPSNVTPNTWEHICWSWVDGYTRSYFDGSEVGTATSGSGNIVSDTGAFYLGRYWASAVYPFKGWVDDLHIYDMSSFTGTLDDLVSDDYNSGTGTNCNTAPDGTDGALLSACYNFGETAGEYAAPSWLADSFVTPAGAPTLYGGLTEETFEDTSDIPTSSGIDTSGKWTQTTLYAGADIVAVASNNSENFVFPSGGGSRSVHLDTDNQATAYLYEDDYDNGHTCSFHFKYTSATQYSVGCGVHMSEDGSGLDGYLAIITTGTSYAKITIYRYDNDTPTSLASTEATSANDLTTDTWYEFSLGHTGGDLVAQLHTIDDWTANIVVSYTPGTAEETYTSGQTLIYAYDSNAYIDNWDSGADSWYVSGVKVITDATCAAQDNISCPFQDNNGNYWGIINVGDASSSDTVMMATSYSPRFTQSDRFYNPILYQGVHRTDFDSYDVQQPAVIYTTGTNTPCYDSGTNPIGKCFMLFYGGNESSGSDVYKIGCAYITPDGDNAPPHNTGTNTVTQWTKCAGNPLISPGGSDVNHVWVPNVIKRTVNHGGTDYDYQMIASNAATNFDLNLYYANDPDGTWTAYGSNPVYDTSAEIGSGALIPGWIFYNADLESFVLCYSFFPVSGVYFENSNDCMHSPDLYTWLPDRQDILDPDGSPTDNYSFDGTDGNEITELDPTAWASRTGQMNYETDQSHTGMASVTLNDSNAARYYQDQVIGTGGDYSEAWILWTNVEDAGTGIVNSGIWTNYADSSSPDGNLCWITKQATAGEVKIQLYEVVSAGYTSKDLSDAFSLSNNTWYKLVNYRSANDTVNCDMYDDSGTLLGSASSSSMSTNTGGGTAIEEFYQNVYIDDFGFNGSSPAWNQDRSSQFGCWEYTAAALANKVCYTSGDYRSSLLTPQLWPHFRSSYVEQIANFYQIRPYNYPFNFPYNGIRR